MKSLNLYFNKKLIWRLYVSNKDFNKLLSQELLMLCLQIKCPAYSGRNIIKVQPEAVPSINYIGRQLDVSYIGSEMYGEIVFCSNAFSHELSVSEYSPTINTYICDPYQRKKREKLITNLIWTQQTILNMRNCTLI